MSWRPSSAHAAGSPFIFNVNEANDSQQMMQFNRPMDQQGQLDVNSLLQVIDADGDGRLTAAEFARVDELFALLDTNNDETISRVELAEAARPNPVGPP